LGADRTEIGNSIDVPTISTAPQIFCSYHKMLHSGAMACEFIGVKFRGPRTRTRGPPQGKATLLAEESKSGMCEHEVLWSKNRENVKKKRSVNVLKRRINRSKTGRKRQTSPVALRADLAWELKHAASGEGIIVFYSRAVQQKIGHRRRWEEDCVKVKAG